MKRILLGAATLWLAVACDDAVAPAPPGLELRILTPSTTDTLWELDPLVLVGEAGAPDLGVLPDDSVWWTLDGTIVGTGHVATVRAAAGTQTIAFHARYNARTATVTRLLHATPGGLGRLLWSVPLDSSGASPLSFDPARGVAYATEQQGALGVAVRTDGSVLWRAALGISAVWTGPAIGPDGTLFFGYYGGPPGGPTGSETGGVLAVNPDGTRRWAVPAADLGPPGSTYYHVHGGVAIDSAGNVYFANEEDDAPLYSLDANGALRWRAATGGAGTHRFWSYTVLVGDTLATSILRTDSMPVVAARSGAVRWRAGVDRNHFCLLGPAVGHDGTLYVPGRAERQVLAFDAAGQLQWSVEVRGFFETGGPVIGRDTLYLGGRNGGVTLISRTGTSLGTFGPAPDGYQDGVTLAANGVLYVAGRDTLYSYDASGVLRFAVPVPHRPSGACFEAGGGPVITDDGTILLRASFGELVALRDTVGPATDAAWPTLQGNFKRNGRRAIDP